MNGNRGRGAALAFVLFAGFLVPIRLTGQEALRPADGKPAPFRIEVVDEQTGRGVPLVELRTVNQIRYVTDSNGIVAFDEPGLLGLKVFFHIRSHGYAFPTDGFGMQGIALETRPGGSAQVKIARRNVAQRLYRVTGAGIYRDSVLTGVPVPVSEPLLNGQVLGQDSVNTAVFQGKIHWFWGDTNRPGYPLGNFHSPGATSELPGKGGLDPSRGINLHYFVNDDGFARPTCAMPGEGPTWITGLVVLRDRQGAERLFANYVKIRPPMETYERGLVEFDPRSQSFQKRATFPMNLAAYPGEHPGGHTFLRREGNQHYIYYCNPYPLVRVPADADALTDPATWEAFSCLQPGSRLDHPRLDRGADGSLRYGWKKRTPVVSREQQDKWVRAGVIREDETLLNTRDVMTDKRVLAHGGSVCWNAYRQRWVMIFVESFGSSFLGEVWYAEAETPVGPWVLARKIVTHEDYSFYNPRHHPMFDQQGGRVLYFEGTYTTSFSGNKDATPRYDYNQVMYQLDLFDERLALPVPVRRTAAGDRFQVGPRGPDGPDAAGEEIAFYAPDRPGIATVPIVEDRDEAGVHYAEAKSSGVGQAARAESDGRPVFYVLPHDLAEPPPGTVPLYAFRERHGTGRYVSVVEEARPGYDRAAHPLGRVWKNPSRLTMW